MYKQTEEIGENSKHQSDNKGFFLWIAFLVIYLTFFNITFVSGSSMDPSLKDRDILIMEKASILLDNLNRGDIISFKHRSNGEDVFFIKRIIGIPGDVVEIKNGSVYVNNEQISEEYLPANTLTFLPEDDYLKETLKEDQYFVLGDNRDNSLDSRFREVGVINKDKIAAKKLFKVINLP